MSLQAHNYQPHAHQQYHENELESLGKTPRPTPAVPTTRTPKPETPTPNPPKVKGTKKVSIHSNFAGSNFI